MQNVRNSVFLFSKGKINLSNTKSFKQSNTKQITNYPSKQNKLIQFNSKNPEIPLTKTISTLINQENSQLSRLKSQKSKEDNNSSKNSLFKPQESLKIDIKKLSTEKETKEDS